jgi:hypothetical protein
MTQPEYSTILCSCNFSEHLLILHFNKDDKEIYLEYHLCSLPFWKRVIIGIKYILGYRSKYGEYGEFIISKDNYKQFKEILTFLKMKLNKAEIISEANARPQHIRYGQAIFNVAYKMYPNAVNKLRGTDLDCFYQDEKVDKFLNALENLLLE